MQQKLHLPDQFSRKKEGYKVNSYTPVSILNCFSYIFVKLNTSHTHRKKRCNLFCHSLYKLKNSLDDFISSAAIWNLSKTNVFHTTFWLKNCIQGFNMKTDVFFYSCLELNNAVDDFLNLWSYPQASGSRLTVY